MSPSESPTVSAESSPRLGTLALGIAEIAAVIGLATFATGWWVFDAQPIDVDRGRRRTVHRPGLAATIAWWRGSA